MKASTNSKIIRMKLILKSLLLSFFIWGSVSAQPAEFSPAPCQQDAENFMVLNFFVGNIGGVSATTNDWVAAFDAQGNLVGRFQLVFGAGFGCPAGFAALLTIAGEQLDAGGMLLCPPPPYGGSPGEALEIVAYQASTGDFYTVATTVPYMEGEFGANNGICTSFSFTEPYTFSPPTPVTLLSFRASAVGGQRVALDWVTGTEQNSSHFEIQHATNGRSWETIGRVAAAGESNSRLEYSFQHLGAAPGQNMYRLRQVDFDGTFDFSPVVLADLQGDKGPRGLRVFPNPAIGQVVTLSLEGEWSSESRSTLYDINGRQVAEWIGLQSGSTTLELPPLPAGIYQLVSRDRSASVSERIVLR